MTPLGEPKDIEPVPDETAAGEAAAGWAALARRIGQGDSAAEAELARVFHERVRLVAQVRLHGSDAAQDIAQETILAVVQALRAGSVRDTDRLPAYIFGVLRNLVNNHRRREARTCELPEDAPDHPVDAVKDRAEFDSERRALVRQALGRLKALDRRILLLTLVDGMTPREIAPLVGLRPEVVRIRKCRAVKVVAQEVGGAIRTPAPNHNSKSGLKP